MGMPGIGDDFGRYRIESRLGYGGMGVVFAALDTVLERRVALKVVNEHLADQSAFVARFHREAVVLARLESPHIITVLDSGTVDGHPFIVTQLVPGGDLGTLLSTRGPLPATAASAVCAQLASALHDAHKAGIVHRDIKPSNVLVRDPDAASLHVLVCDFGVAHDASATSMTAAGSVIGTWAYLAPEVADGEPATVASDVYALGCLLWATLTGRAPYAGSEAAILRQHQDAAIPQLDGNDPLSRQLNAVLRTAMAKDPADRHSDAESLARDLLGHPESAHTAVRPPAVQLSRATAVPQPETRIAKPGRRSAPASATKDLEPSASSSPAPSHWSRKWSILVGAAAAVLAVGLLVVVQPWTDGDGGPGAVRATGVTGDVDGDGLGDVSVREVDGDDVHFELLRSTGGEFDRKAHPYLDNDDLTMAQADLDDDGDLEVVSASFPRDDAAGRGAMRVVVASGDESFDIPVDLSDPGLEDEPIGRPSLATGDFGGDAGDDVALWVPGGKVHLLISRGGLGQPMSVFTAALPTGSVAWINAADVDGDGVDEVVYNGLARRVDFDTHPADKVLPIGRQVLDLTDDGQSLSPRSDPQLIGRGAHASAFADFDDTDRTLLVDLSEVIDGEATLTVSYIQDGGAFVEDTSQSISLRAQWGPAVALSSSDVNGDGADDLVMAGDTSDPDQREIMVALARNGSFDDPELWATLPDCQTKDSCGASFG